MQSGLTGWTPSSPFISEDLLPVCAQTTESSRQACPAGWMQKQDKVPGTRLGWRHPCGWSALNSVGGPVCLWLCRLISLPTKAL